jgi:phosphoglucosamine mutase
MTQEVLGGTDGFRGEFTTQSGPARMNRPTIKALSSALVEHIDYPGGGKFVTARDTRPHGEALLDAAIEGIVEAGADVWNLGVAPTPVAQKIAEEINAVGAVVITASHNPVHDNGWKGMIGNRKPDRHEVEGLSGIYWHRQESPLRAESSGAMVDAADDMKRYEDLVVSDIESQFGTDVLDGKVLVVDGANGAAEQITPQVLRRLGARVIEYSTMGNFGGIINHGCGAADLNGARKYLYQYPELAANPRFLGVLANDGDGDRLMGLGVRYLAGGQQVVEVNGNHMMWAMARGEPGIVGTEYTNSGLRRRLQEEGIDFDEVPNGDVHVTQGLRTRQAAGEVWRRGGEFTGHLIDTSWLGSGDGVRMAAWMAAYLSSREMTLGDLHEDLPLWHERMGAVKVVRGNDLLQTDSSQRIIAEAHDALGADGRLIVRASGTEPKIRIWAEGTNMVSVHSAVEQALEQIERQVA